MSDTSTTTPLATALALEVDGDVVHTTIHDGFDVFGIPHGGYLAALAGRAVLAVAGLPDLFTITTHFVRKCAVGPLEVHVRRLGASRRFSSLQATAVQDGEVVLTTMALAGDRTGMEGPTWSDQPAWHPGDDDLSPPAGHPELPFTAPRVAEQFGLRLDTSTAGFAVGRRGDHARLRARLDDDGQPVDQFTALLACDITPPAAWNPLGMQGWVPTMELTAHVRARPVDGPLTVEVDTHHVGDGFLEEDALVRDASGHLVVQSRQLARWTAT